MLQKITPYLWFNDQAEAAAAFYTSVFPNSRINDVARMGEGGQVLTVSFDLEGLTFTALNGGPQFTFTEAVSFVVHCETQEEVDRYWNALIADGGEESMCGWLKDRYGLSWQIIPEALMRMLSDEDPQRANAVMQAMLQMRKIEVPVLQEAYDSVAAPA